MCNELLMMFSTVNFKHCFQH
ncbi:hypothetical protein GHO35_12740 [Pseudomonas helleri]|uniref:Uncharacterized protein n=1 Tax=Pseudomonas helleri TaxID=1608996 RepID=A0A6I1WER3_9PSED|nr:hypothetical protein [Pseudomonas helleri]MQU08795.1 hypothetical protein [Pseudomonas helleri]MQU22009.1 hypothetical protein [Pseudomonas helleri]MQU41184.1 hypothetical protein [Pseudomonas helleri]